MAFPKKLNRKSEPLLTGENPLIQKIQEEVNKKSKYIIYIKENVNGIQFGEKARKSKLLYLRQRIYWVWAELKKEALKQNMDAPKFPTMIMNSKEFSLTFSYTIRVSALDSWMEK